MMTHRNDNINNYLFIAFFIHSMFLLFAFTTKLFVNDITTVGETGMTIQMIVLEKSEEVFEKSLASQQETVESDDAEKDQQVLMDNRKAGDKTNYTYDTYYGRVRQIIDSNKSYPTLAKQRRQEGSPKVTFTILKNGVITNVSVESSGYRLLDREALRMIRKSSPFPKIPDSMGKNKIDLTVPINFTLSY